MTNQSPLDRRAFLAVCSVAGISHPALVDALWRKSAAVGVPRDAVLSPDQQPQAPLKITKEMLVAAEAVIGLELTDAEREMLLQDVNTNLTAYADLRKAYLPNSVPPALLFRVELPGREIKAAPTLRLSSDRDRRVKLTKPASAEALAFLPVHQLAQLVRDRQVTSRELTTLYLDRLKRHGPTLLCVTNLTERRALAQAEAADREIARGNYRGPLHGIPWGAKDLLAVPDYPTTWGSPIYKDQVLPETATVVERLDKAGAVLVAKLTLGELAQGDVWYGGMTKNPWKLDQGSSGSSAGPASATAAGLVGFSLGTETLGSIVSPSTRCGVAGLRPTFGRVSRAGAMALSWSMDKIGPICRSAEDCGHVLGAIHGADGKDPTALDRPFKFNPTKKPAGLRVGYLKAAFDADSPTKQFDADALAVLKTLGIDPIPVDLTTDIPVTALRIILSAEAAAAFDELTRSNKDDLMARQGRGAWPNSFRTARFIPAVEYIQANRWRTLLMRKMDEVMESVDLFVTPSFGGTVLLTTNLTGHPTLCLPSGFRPDGTPVSISFVGKLFGEADLVTVGMAYEEAAGFAAKRPAGFA
ncbi:MAG: amidase [Gemmatimonadota bacterium]